MSIRPVHAVRCLHRWVVRTVAAHVVVVLAIGGLLAVVGGGLALWLDGGRHRFLPKNWGVVEQGLIYRSGQIHGDLIEDVLRANHIQTVIDLSGDYHRSHEDAELAVVERLGIDKLTVDGLDGSGLGPIESYAKAFCRLVEERRKGRPVLVHCRAGSQRTGALVALYRVLVEEWTPARAYEEYLRYRRRPPTDNALFEYLDEHMDAFVERVRAGDALRGAPRPLPQLGAAAVTPTP